MASMRTELAVIKATMATKADLEVIKATMTTMATKADLLEMENKMKDWVMKLALSFAALMLTTQIAVLGIFYKLITS